MERLGHVVVGAQIQTLGLVGGRASSREQDHRNRPPLADLAHDLDAVHVGHDDVQKDDVRPDLFSLGQGLFAARSRHHSKALIRESHRHELGYPLLVVRDEDEGLGAHGRLFLRRILCAVSIYKAIGNRAMCPYATRQLPNLPDVPAVSPAAHAAAPREPWVTIAGRSR